MGWDHLNVNKMLMLILYGAIVNPLKKHKLQVQWANHDRIPDQRCRQHSQKGQDLEERISLIQHTPWKTKANSLATEKSWRKNPSSRKAFLWVTSSERSASRAAPQKLSIRKPVNSATALQKSRHSNPPASPACLVKWGLVMDCLSILVLLLL